MSDDVKTLSSKVVYQNPWMTVREDTFERSSGAQGIYGVVDKPDFVVVIPLHDNGDVTLVEQYRYPVKRRELEFPQGAWESQPDADPLDVAKGELREETGLLAEHWHYVGEQYLAYGFCAQRYHIFVAQGFTQTTQQLDDEEEGLVVKRLPLAQFEQYVLDGTVKDATSVNSFGLARLKGLI